MISVREGRTELTDILLSGATIDPDIRERVRLLQTVHYMHTQLQYSAGRFSPLHAHVMSCTQVWYYFLTCHVSSNHMSNFSMTNSNCYQIMILVQSSWPPYRALAGLHSSLQQRLEMLPLHNLSSEQELMLISRTRYDGTICRQTLGNLNCVKLVKVHTNSNNYIYCQNFDNLVFVMYADDFKGYFTIMKTVILHVCTSQYSIKCALLPALRNYV